jgi:hypothetical protein
MLFTRKQGCIGPNIYIKHKTSHCALNFTSIDCKMVDLETVLNPGNQNFRPQFRQVRQHDQQRDVELHQRCRCQPGAASPTFNT